MCMRGSRGRGGGSSPDPLENHNAKCFPRSIGLGPLENHNAISTQHAFNEPAYETSFKLRLAGGPMMLFTALF